MIKITFKKDSIAAKLFKQALVEKAKFKADVESGKYFKESKPDRVQELPAK